MIEGLVVLFLLFGVEWSVAPPPESASPPWYVWVVMVVALASMLVTLTPAPRGKR